MEDIIRKFKKKDTIDISVMLIHLYQLVVIVALVWCYSKFR